MLKKLLIGATFAALIPLAACSGGDGDEKAETAKTEVPAAEAKQAEPDFISVQHILIAFQGSVPGKPVTRSQEEAGKLAAELLTRANGGEDFGALVSEYTDDAAPGIYKMANFSAQGDMAQRIYPRAQMVKAFGDIGFPMEVGGIGMAVYDPVNSPYGWHIVKRVE